MNNTIIKIGRNPKSNDIIIPEEYDTVSNNHAEIEQQGNGLIYHDHSTNGTVINGQKIHNTDVRVFPEDRILLAGVYELDWRVIRQYFPNLSRPTVASHVSAGGGRQTVRLSTPTVPLSSQHKDRPTEPFHTSERRASPTDSVRKDNFGQANAYSQAEIDAAIRRWNWGAFFCSWIWAAFHKTYWPLFILIVGLIPYIGQVCSLALSVYLGISGSKIAWECGKYADFESYKNAQRNWTIIGLILFILGGLASAFLVFTTLSMI
ncbi:MAG TPA: FHA domain-containing protein [Candidatus Phocaeicola excrementigallinarum]|nr:FHA domain-containing protein [Candidatus Phocaeicola excrementigallinarum]